MTKFISNIIYPSLISIVIYLFFFYPLLDPQTLIYSGKDSIRLHYLSRIYLYDNFQNNQFPFWTERMFGGFPIFYDLERGYQNLDNILLVYLFGPYNSYKIIHFICYLLGTVSLFLLFKKKYSFEKNEIYLYYAAAVLIYYFSFFHLIHQQHFNFILATYLLPFLVYCLEYLIDTSKLRYTVLLSYCLYFIFTLGSTQIFLTIILFLILYFLNFYNYRQKNNITNLVLVLLFTFLLIFPGAVSYYSLYSKSSRSEFSNFYQGSLDSNLLVTFVYPHPFGLTNYLGTNLSENYTKNESLLYLGIISILIFTLFFRNLKPETIKFGICLLILFTVMNFINLPPFNYFRYWVRAEFLFSFYYAFFLPEILIKSSKLLTKSLKYLLLLIIYLLPFLLNKNLIYIFKNSIPLDFINVTIPFFGLVIVFFTAILFIRKYSLVLLVLIIIDSAYFFSISKGSLFMKQNEIFYQNITTTNSLKNFDSDYSLAYSSKNNSGYTQLAIKEGLNNQSHYISIDLVLKLYLIALVMYFSLLVVLYKKYEIKI